jgi:hypothetical protein
MRVMLIFAEHAATMTDEIPEAWRAYIAELRASGAMFGGEHLALPHAATTLRLDGTRRVVREGPYLQGQEQIGGFVLLDVPDMGAALEWAARCPAARDGAVEVRPLMGG